MALSLILWPVSIALVLLLLLSAYIVCFVALGFYSFAPQTAATEIEHTQRLTRFLILVPAHNESAYLRPTLRSVHAVDYPADHFDVIVIADNCTDDTAHIAVQEGCRVWKRTDLELRGKGHALRWVFANPEIQTWDAIVIIDADSVASSNLLRVFNQELQDGHSVLQSRYDFEFAAEASRWLVQTSRCSKRAEDCFISRPRSRFQLHQGLQGNGFCLQTGVLLKVPWHAGSICEDLEYGLELAQHGWPVRYVEATCVTASMTGRLQHASGQRRRWAGGTFALIVERVPALLKHSIRQRDWRSLEACLYLLTLSRLPLLLLTALTAAIMLTIQISDPHRINMALWLAFMASLVLQVGYAIAMLSTTQKESGFIETILGLPVYATWLAAQQCMALLSRCHTTWNRTERG